MSVDYNWDLEDPLIKRGSGGGGGRGAGYPGSGPAGGFQAFAGGGMPGFAGGQDFGTDPTNPRQAMLRRLMAAIAAMRPAQDNVNADLQTGEFVVNAPATAMARPELERLNAAGNETRSYVMGGPVELLGAVSAPASTGAGAGASAALGPLAWVPAALEAVKFVSGLIGGKEEEGPNGLERARAMGYGPEEGYAYGGYVRNPYSKAGGSGMYGRPRPGARPGAQPAASPFVPPVQQPSPTPGGTGVNTPGTVAPTSAMDELLRRYAEKGAFDPGYGMAELEAALNRHNQGAQRADVTDLMASGLDDPSLYASQLLASRSARSKDASASLASARQAQIQSAQDWIRGLLGSRHQDQIAELLARIK